MTKILFKNGNVFYHGKLQKLDVLIEGKKIISIKKATVISGYDRGFRTVCVPWQNKNRA